MAKKKSDIGSDLEDLFKKTIEINTRYFKEGAELASRLGKSSKTGANTDLFQPETMASAFTAFARLNLEHYQNIVDLGFSLTRQAASGSDQDQAAHENVETGTGEPAFELSGTVTPEGKAKMDFVLDNTLKREVTCQFENTDFVSESEPELSFSFDTTFTPQSVILSPGESRKVTIETAIDPGAEPGFYTSRVKVHGFDPLFFLVRLNIPDNPTKKPGNGKKKGK
jgi:hypothetical protein